MFNISPAGEKMPAVQVDYYTPGGRVIQVGLLADHPQAAPLLADWFRAQWPDYFAAWTETAVLQMFHDEANRHGIPIRLVAFVDETLAGTVLLRAHAVEWLPAYSPGLGGLLVVDARRRRGVGTALVEAGMALAAAAGYSTLFAGTENARGLLERLGWIRIRDAAHGGEQVSLYRVQLAPPA